MQRSHREHLDDAVQGCPLHQPQLSERHVSILMMPCKSVLYTSRNSLRGTSQLLTASVNLAFRVPIVLFSILYCPRPKQNTTVVSENHSPSLDTSGSYAGRRFLRSILDLAPLFGLFSPSPDLLPSVALAFAFLNPVRGSQPVLLGDAMYM